MSHTSHPHPPLDSCLHGPADASGLRRNLGVASIVFMVLAAAAPLAVVGGLVPLVLATSQTPAAPVFYLACALVLVLFSVGFTAMSRYVPNAGAFYTYIQRGLGRVVGSGAAILSLWSYVLLMIASLFYIGALIADTLEASFGTALLPWWVWALAAVALIGFLGYRDIELSAKVLTTLLVVETIAVIVIDIAIIGAGGDRGLSLAPFNPAEIGDGSIGLGIMFAFLGFIGFEATAVFRNEARDPDRTIPRATYIAVIGIGFFYAISAWAVVIGVGTSDAVATATADPVGMVPDLAARYVSPILNDVISVLMITSFIAAALTFHNVITRYAFTLGGTGLLPRSLGRVHPRHRAPTRASLVFTAIEAVVVVIGVASTLDPILELYTWMSGAAMLGLVALMVLTSVAVAVFFRRKVPTANVWRTLIIPVLAALCLAVILVTLIANYELLVGSGPAAVIIEVLMLAAFAAGVNVALIYRSRRRQAYARLASDDASSDMSARSTDGASS